MSRAFRTCRAARVRPSVGLPRRRIGQHAAAHILPPHAEGVHFELVGGWPGALDGPCRQWMVARMLSVHAATPSPHGSCVRMGAMLGAWWPMLEIREP